MQTPRPTARSDPDATLAGAWQALEQARWQDARALFARACRTDDRGEALEGLSWAAWWLDDADTVFEARLGAYRAYSRTGHARAAARLAIWLAIDHLDFHGTVAVANGWARRAARLLQTEPPAPEHGWLAFFEGYLALAGCDTDHAEALGRRTADLGGQLRVPDLQMLGLALAGAAQVACARVREGMDCLDEATAIALEAPARVPIAGAWACCFLVSACTAVRDFERAVAWCDRIMTFAERYGSRYMLAFCRGEYAAVHMWRGEWGEAEALLTASVEDFSSSRPAMTAAPLAGLADLRRRQGRWQEALALLGKAGTSDTTRLCRARLHLDRGETGSAAALAERLLRQIPPRRGLDRAPALEVLVRARVARGELEAADTGIDELRAIAVRAGSEALQAAVELCAGIRAAAGGDHAGARSLLEDAVDRYERAGGVFEAATARLELATSLLVLGLADEAARELRAAQETAGVLGATNLMACARRMAPPPAAGGGTACAPMPVTQRERQVLALVAAGLTNREIARRLSLSEHTVHRHVTNILRKLDLPSRTAAAARAVRLGLLDPDR